MRNSAHVVRIRNAINGGLKKIRAPMVEHRLEQHGKAPHKGGLNLIRGCRACPRLESAGYAGQTWRH